MVEYTLVRGEHNPSTSVALKALVKTPAGQGHRYMLLKITVSVTLLEDMDTESGFKCRTLSLDASKDVQETTFEFGR